MKEKRCLLPPSGICENGKFQQSRELAEQGLIENVGSLLHVFFHYIATI